MTAGLRRARRWAGVEMVYTDKQFKTFVRRRLWTGDAMKTILLADDEAHLRMLVRTTLADPAYRIVEAADGTAALALARQERPDLVVLDWMMPGLSGIDVAKALRQDPTTAHIPIIMLTAKGQATDQAHGRALDTYAYLIKPFSPLELLETVRAVLGPAPS